MWKCHKCGKPVYFAERKQSLGYDWHPECLRCEECGKRLNPGQHAEHKGVPYCHVPCYGALFGPQLFGHGTRVESHTSFGKVENRTGCSNLPRSHLESKLKVFNQYYDGRSGEIRSREVNGRLVLEGALRICWGVMHMIHLKEDDDQRTVVTIRKRNSYRSAIDNGFDDDLANDDDLDDGLTDDSGKPISVSSDVATCSSSSGDAIESKSATLPSKLELKEWDELDELLQVERPETNDKLYQTLPCSLPAAGTNNINDNNTPLSPEASISDELSSPLQTSSSSAMENFSSMHTVPVYLERRSVSLIEGSCDGGEDSDDDIGSLTAVTSPEEEAPRQARRLGSTAIRRRPGRRRSRTKLKRRCSINGHFYNRETSFFLPPHGSLMSVWVTSLVSTNEVINLMLEKYKVDSPASNFALFVVRDNGEQRRLREDEYPLLVRVMLGPHEEVAKLFLMDALSTEEISSEVAQFLNLSTAECRAILERYSQEEEREVKRIRAKYREMRRRIKQRMEDLKVRL